MSLSQKHKAVVKGDDMELHRREVNPRVTVNRPEVVYAVSDKRASQIDNASTVKLKTLHCHSAAWGDAEYRQPVRTPPKMRTPLLLAGMIERRPATCRRVIRCCRGELVAVASLARPR